MANKIIRKDYNFRLSVVKHYLNTGDSIRKISKIWNIHYTTVYKWIKSFRKNGNLGLSNYHTPWNKFSKSIEKKVILLKEREPAITVRKTKEILNVQGINISTKGIWSIWKRYGYAGFDKKSLNFIITKCIPWSSEAKKKYDQALHLFETNNLKNALELINSIPSLPDNELLEKISDADLNLRRIIEKYIRLFLKMPLSHYLRKVESLYNNCKRKKLYFSALKVGILYAGALSYQGKQSMFSLTIKELTELMKPQGGYFSNLLFLFKFALLVGLGIVRVKAFDFNGAYKIINKCKELTRHRKILPDEFIKMIGILYTWVQDYRQAELCLLKNNMQESDITVSYDNPIAVLYFHKWDYKKIRSVKRSKMKDLNKNNLLLLFEASNSLFNGNPEQAITLATQSIEFAKKEQFYDIVSSAYIIIASALSSLGNTEKAKKFIWKIYLLSEKSAYWQQIIALLTLKHKKEELKNLANGNFLPLIKIIALLKLGDYKKAFMIAQQKYLISDFLFFVPFFPETVLQNAERKKIIGIPKRMLQLPIFNNTTKVYYVKFLGPTVIFKRQKYLKLKLNPKDEAFLLYLSFKAGGPKKTINLSDIYTNFWPNSEKASRNFSHLLVRVKKTLKIPSHLLTISRCYGENYLVNNGIYFTTDYQEFEQTIARAKALQRAGEWEFAKKEFLQAFKLFRGEPFKKNFDDWSVDMRFRILSELENEAINFAKACLEHNNKNDARRILQKVLKIAPDSQEIIEIVKKLNCH